MSVLIVAEHDNVTLKEVTLHAVTAAQALGGDVHVLVAGADCQAVAQSAAKIDGVAKVLVADDASLAHGLAEDVAPLAVGLADAYDYIIAAATTTGKNLMPRVAALLDIAQISDIVEIKSGDTFVRPIYAGNALATVQTSDAKKVLTIRPTAFSAATADGGSANVEAVATTASSGKANFVSQELSQSERPELSAARVVVSGGRGMGSEENFATLGRLADILNAAVGASRAAVDAGYAANDLQVGQTGKIVAPDLYIAVGISGAIQHLAGMKDSKVIVAINKDEDAPIFDVADYGLVADLFTALPELEAELLKG